MGQPGRLVLTDSQQRFIASIPLGTAGIVVRTVTPIPKYKTSIALMHLKGVAGQQVHIDFIGLAKRARTASKTVIHTDPLEVFSPALLATQDERCYCLEDADTVQVEFNHTDDAVAWRDKHQQDLPEDADTQYVLIISAYWEKK
jgi:hypothetical protein